MAAQAAMVAQAIKSADNRKLIIVGSFVLIGGVLVYFLAIKPILEFWNLKDTKEEKDGKKAFDKLDRNQALSSQAYLKNRDKVTITSATAAKLASDAYEGRWGGCYGLCDDEDRGIGAVTGAGSKVNISYVAYKFNQLYGADFSKYLKDYLESEDWTNVENYVDKAPNW